MAWLGGRDQSGQSLLAGLVNRPQVRDWLSIGMHQAGLMRADAESQGLFLVAVDVPNRAGQLVALVDLSEFLFHELRLQLGLYRVVVLGRGEALLEIRPMGPRRSLSNGMLVNHLMQRRHIGLPGGPMMTLEVYPGTQNDWLLAGVETQAQHDQLRAWGCDLFQGFLLARPMPLAALTEFLRR